MDWLDAIGIAVVVLSAFGGVSLLIWITERAGRN